MDGYSGTISENCVVREVDMKKETRKKYYNVKKAFGLPNTPYPRRAILMEKYIYEWIYEIEMNII